MEAEYKWNLMDELVISCLPVDNEGDFNLAEDQLKEMVDRTGLSTAQKSRLKADIIKAGFHGYGQIARIGECIFILIQFYVKEKVLRDKDQDFSDNQEVENPLIQPRLQVESFSASSNECGWGYFLIERIAENHHDGQASSYIIEIFLYREV